MKKFNLTQTESEPLAEETIVTAGEGTVTSIAADELYLSTAGVNPVTPGSPITSTGTIYHKYSGVVPGTYDRVTVDATGHVTYGRTLITSDIPNLDATKITSGQFGDDRIVNASKWNAKSTVSGVNDGTNWTSITIDDVTKNIPTGGSGSAYIAGDGIDITDNVISLDASNYSTTDKNIKLNTVKSSTANGINIGSSYTLAGTTVKSEVATGINSSNNGNLSLQNYYEKADGSKSYFGIASLAESSATTNKISAYYTDSSEKTNAASLTLTGTDSNVCLSSADQSSDSTYAIKNSLDLCLTSPTLASSSYSGHQQVYVKSKENGSIVDYTPVDDQSLVTKKYVDSKVGNIVNVNVDGESIVTDNVANLYTSLAHPYSSSNRLATLSDISQAGGGTVYSVRVAAGTGLVSSENTTKTDALDTTISIDSNYKLPTTAEWTDKARGVYTNDNWTQLTINGVTKNIPAGGSSSGVSDVKVNNTSVVTSGVANLVTNTDYDATNNKIATMADVSSAGGGTVTSVRVQAGAGLKSSQSTAQTNKLDTTISLDDGYTLPLTDTWTTVVSNAEAGAAKVSCTDDNVKGLGYTKNEGTVKSVQVKTGTGLDSSVDSIQQSELSTTISINSNYKLPTNAEWNNLSNTATTGANKISCTDDAVSALGYTKVSGENDGSNWTSITIGNLTYNIPSGGGGGTSAGVSSIGGKSGVVTIGSNLYFTGQRLEAKDTTYSIANQTNAGLISATDKQKLDGISAGATATSVSTTAVAGASSAAAITVDGTSYNIVGQSGGTVTSITAGNGLIGGEITTIGTLAVDFSAVQSKLPSATTAGQILKANSTTAGDVTWGEPVSGTYDNNNWLTIKIDGVERNIPSGGSSSGISDVQLKVSGAISGTSVVTSGIATLVTNQAYNAESNTIATMADISEAGGGTVTKVTAGIGLITTDGSDITKAGTIKVKLSNEDKNANDSVKSSSSEGGLYAIEADNSGNLAVRVPWQNTTYENKTAASGGTDVSLVTTGEKYTWDNKQDKLTAASDSGISISGTAISNTDTYQTEAPTTAATDGRIHIVYLESEPDEKFDGYIYFIKEA